MPFDKHLLFKTFLLFGMVFLISSKTSALNNLSADSVTTFLGTVYDTISHAPEKLPVKAKLVLERLPYGSEIGITYSEDSTGQFEYGLAPGYDYSLSIRADGYETMYETISQSMKNNLGQVLRNYFLQPKFKEGDVVRLNRLIFAQGKSYITEESTSELDYLMSILRENPKMVIQLEGHTDYLGNPKVNQKLSEDRVKAAKEYLIGKGIDSKRVKTKAYGGSKPISRVNTPEAHRLNRRVEVRILKAD